MILADGLRTVANLRARWLVGTGAVLVLGLTACSSPAPYSPTTAPTAQDTAQPAASNAVLQVEYQAASDAYSSAEKAIAAVEGGPACDATSASADLNACQNAYGQDRHLNMTYDAAIKAMAFPVSDQADVTVLLGVQGQIEAALEQAVTAPTLAAIANLQNSFGPLYTAWSTADTKIRSDISGSSPTAPTTAPPSTPAPTAVPVSTGGGGDTSLDGSWSGTTTSPVGEYGTPDNELLTFTVSNGEIINWQGTTYGGCIQGPESAWALPASPIVNGHIQDSQKVVPNTNDPNEFVFTDVTGTIAGNTAFGTVTYTSVGPCTEPTWTWKAHKN